MKASTYKEFRKLRKRLAAIEIVLAELVSQNADRAAAKTLGQEVDARAEGWKKAVDESPKP